MAPKEMYTQNANTMRKKLHRISTLTTRNSCAGLAVWRFGGLSIYRVSSSCGAKQECCDLTIQGDVGSITGIGRLCVIHAGAACNGGRERKRERRVHVYKEAQSFRLGPRRMAAAQRVIAC